VPECPIYSPDWGKAVSDTDIPVRRALIRELALEVGASQGRGSVIIQAVYPGGNAEKAGLHVGDRIVRFNGRKVKNVKQFTSIVARAKPESDVEVEVIREGRKVKEFVMIGEGEMEGVTVPAK
ncbi:MAG: PDZ domain-containing protein, partial [Planctomycetota bacterium]